MVPVSPSVALTRMPAWALEDTLDTRGCVHLPFTEFLTWLLENVTVSTTLLDRPPTDPMERPCPPEQTEFSKVIPWPYHQFPLQRRLAPDNVITHSAGIDSNTIVLVITGRTGNDHIRRTANVKAIGILPLAVTSSVINSHASNSQTIRTVDADGLDGRVLNMKVGYGRAGEVMRVEELGLRHASRAPLAIPVL